jgi:hypothetical protein
VISASKEPSAASAAHDFNLKETLSKFPASELKDFSSEALSQLSHLVDSKTKELSQWLNKFNDSRKETSIEASEENAEKRQLSLSDEGKAQTFSSNGVTQASAHIEDSLQQILDDYRNGRITAEEFNRRKFALSEKNASRSSNSSRNTMAKGGKDRKYIISLTIILLLVLGTLSAFSNFSSSRDPDGRLKIPKNSSNYKGSNYSTVIAELRAAGFSNVRTTVLDDLIMGWLTKDGEVESVEVDGSTTFRAGARYAPDVPIVVTYHTYPVKTANAAKEAAPTALSSNSPSAAKSDTSNTAKPDTRSVSVNFSEEYAFRAAVVAFTNCFANDVFMPDGNNYDISKFHSYADVRGFFMHVESKGNWTAKDENTWHVERLKLRVDKFNTVVDVSLDVSFDGANYKVFNLAGKAPSHDDNDARFSSMKSLEAESDSKLFFVVPPKLIKDNRGTLAPTKQTQKTTNDPEKYPSGISIWDGDHTGLKKLIKKSMKDEKSYKHIETKWIYIDDSAKRQDINALLAKIGWKDKISIGDFIIITEFSGKNSFNATVKKTAYGIKYKNGNIKLLGIK